MLPIFPKKFLTSFDSSHTAKMLTSLSKMFLLHQIFRILASEQDEVPPIFFLSPILEILASQQEKILPILPKMYFFTTRFRSFFEFWISTKECCRSLGVGGETPYGNY